MVIEVLFFFFLQIKCLIRTGDQFPFVTIPKFTFFDTNKIRRCDYRSLFLSHQAVTHQQSVQFIKSIYADNSELNFLLSFNRPHYSYKEILFLHLFRYSAYKAYCGDAVPPKDFLGPNYHSFLLENIHSYPQTYLDFEHHIIHFKHSPFLFTILPFSHLLIIGHVQQLSNQEFFVTFNKNHLYIPFNS
jgi:hypothetical protein